MNLRLLCLLTALLTACPLSSTLRAAEVAPTDPLIRYVGRFDHTDKAGPRCTWSASEVEFTVSGGSASITLKDSGKNVWQVVIDGKPTTIIKLASGEKNYPVAANLSNGTHLIELVRRTEASFGLTQILGLTLDDTAKLLPTPARPHRIEIIGDSISCGYGDEAPNKETHFSAATENAYLAYGAVAARAVDADYVCIAWSGKKLWPNNSIVDLYDRTAPKALKTKWDFATEIPDVVVINLGTNDFNVKKNPEEAGWVAAYVDFIKQIHSHYPKAPIYCAVGPMMSDWPKVRKPRTTILGYLAKVVTEANAAGGPSVRIIDFGVQSASNGLGADWHPSVKTHALLGAQLAKTLKQDLKW